METWEDCLASLRAGASPEEVLPKIRALFTTLPEAPSASVSRDEPTLPTARLYYTFSEAGDHVFQLPYLRAPFHVWETAASSERPDERRTMFDSELSIDVLSAFQPRFVAPPERCVREMLKRFVVSEGGVSDSDEEGSEVEIEMEGVVSEAIDKAVRKGRRVEEVRRLSRALSRYFQCESDEGREGELEMFPMLSVAEWSLLFSGLEEGCNVSVEGVKRLLLEVNQASLSMVVLQSVFPMLVADGSNSDEIEEYTDLVTTAVSRAELHKLPVGQVRSLLDLYRGMDAGVLGALAQLKVVTSIGSRQ